MNSKQKIVLGLGGLAGLFFVSQNLGGSAVEVPTASGSVFDSVLGSFAPSVDEGVVSEPVGAPVFNFPEFVAPVVPESFFSSVVGDSGFSGSKKDSFVVPVEPVLNNLGFSSDPTRDFSAVDNSYLATKTLDAPFSFESFLSPDNSFLTSTGFVTNTKSIDSSTANPTDLLGSVLGISVEPTDLHNMIAVQPPLIVSKKEEIIKETSPHVYRSRSTPTPRAPANIPVVVSKKETSSRYVSPIKPVFKSSYIKPVFKSSYTAPTISDVRKSFGWS